MANETRRKPNKSRNTRGRKKFDQNTNTEKEIAHKYNDVSWYVKNEAMLRDAASLSFNNPLGSKVDVSKLWRVTNDNGLSDLYAAKSVPGLMSMEFLPCIGLSTDSTSPANLAAQNIYSYVRYMNSGAKNYDQADLMLYLLSMDSIYMFWNWAKRIYGYAMMYSQKNKYMPKVYAAADKIDLDSIIHNLSDYRLWLNNMAARISSFCVPAVMPYFIRHSWMVTNIYADDDTSKAQQYMFVPGGFYLYDETGSTYGGRLQMLCGPGAQETMTFTDIIKIGNRLVDAVSYSEDIGVMSGDILKAYGQDKLFKLSPVDPDYRVVPVCNEEVLSQIENSTGLVCNREYTDDTISGAKLWSGMEIAQNPDTGFLTWNPDLLPSNFERVGIMLNMHKEEVTPADVMVGTRLTACQKGDAITAVGTEFIYQYFIWTFNSSGEITGADWTHLVYLGKLNDQLGAEVTLGALPVIFKATEFRRRPQIPVTCMLDGQFYFVGAVRDTSNYTIVDDETIEQIHGTAIMSEFNIPQIGSF